MLIFIFGEDSFSSRNQVNAMKDKFLEKFDLIGANISIFDVNKTSTCFGEVAQAIMTPPFLSQKRMVIVKNLISSIKKADEEMWTETLCKVPDTSIVIIIDSIESSKAGKSKLVAKCRESADSHVYEHNPLSESQAISWVMNYAKKKSAKLDLKLAKMIVQTSGSDLWILSSEINKLISFCNCRDITEADIKLMILPNADDQLFECLDSIMQNNPSRAIVLLKKQRQFGTSDAQIFSMLIKQVRLLVACLSLQEVKPQFTKQELAKELGVHPFVAQKLISQSKKFNLCQMINFQRRLFEMEKLIKTSILDFDQAVDGIVVEFHN